MVFDSALLEQAVRAELEKPEGIITPEDLERVEQLAVAGQNLLGPEQDCDCRIFEYVDGLPQENEPHGDISGLSLLARMPNLKTLYLCQQEIEDLSPLSGLPLEELYLTENYITDLSPLRTLSDLRVLCLGGNPAYGLSPLSSLSQLRVLNLDSTDGTVDSLSPLAELHLRQLCLCNQVPADGDWSALRHLEFIGLLNCRGMDYTPLLRVPTLERVEVWDELCRRELERDCPQEARTFAVTGEPGSESE